MPLHSSAPLPPHSLSLSQQTIAWPLHTPLPLLAALMIIQSDICDAGLNDDRLQHGLDFAIGEYNKERTMSTRATPLDLHPMAEQQTVTQTLDYFFGMKIGLTTGTKSQPDLDNCLISDQPQWKEFCSFQVYEVPSKDGMSLVKSIRGKA
uniref:Cystatin domain-containing protein n=1 Tax=Theropithecus gelada TaxID=9565 RepID=A0A8D2FTP6_THEGE